MDNQKLRIGEVLVQRNIISEEQLANALGGEPNGHDHIGLNQPSGVAVHWIGFHNGLVGGIIQIGVA